MLRALVAGLCAALSLASGASAQTYPSQPIPFIAPFPPVGSAGTIARLLASWMAQSLWRQAAVVENRPGAGGNIGVELIAKSPPDGYTVGIGAAGALAINQSLMGKLPYDPQKDLVAVAKLADIPIVLAVANATPAASVPD